MKWAFLFPLILKRSKLIFVFCSLLFLVSCHSSHYISQRGSVIEDEVEPLQGTTFAVIVGISNYSHVYDLNFAHKDAEAFETFIKKSQGDRIQQENIITLLNHQATKQNVANALTYAVRNSKKGDRIFFFFAGHGDMEVSNQKENGLLLLHNSPNGNYFGIIDDVIEIEQLKKYFDLALRKGVELIYIIDACHSGNLSGGQQGKRQTAAALLSDWGNEFKILSCQPNQHSLESTEWGNGRGLFSFEMEKALYGKADENKDRNITMLELYSYLLKNVSGQSRDKQIPLITGDLSKIFISTSDLSSKFTPAPPVDQLGLNEPPVELFVNSQQRELFRQFSLNLNQKRLIYPQHNSATSLYRKFENSYPGHLSIPYMRRILIDSLQSNFIHIVSPMLSGKTSYSTKNECELAAEHLDTCLVLLGENHFMYPGIKARCLYMKAMALTWALSESEYNNSWNSVVERSISYLEESFELEPNAAYTSITLGERHFFLADYLKAEYYFRLYLGLRPNDYYGKLLLGDLYTILKQYDKVEILYKELSNKYLNIEYIWKTSSTLLYNHKIKEGLLELQKILVLGDTFNYFFCHGLAFGQLNMADSSIYYYQKAIEKYGPWTPCYNNIGYRYLLMKQMDSASHYLKLAAITDPKQSLPYFNLGTLSTITREFKAAENYFKQALAISNEKQYCFIMHSGLYFNKRYTFPDSSEWEEFNAKVHTFKNQYIFNLSLAYSLIRSNKSGSSEEEIEKLFESLFQFKQYESITRYHYACWNSLKRNKIAAFEHLEKALELGFGNPFQIQYDTDLEFVRNSPEFTKLYEKYFSLKK